MIAWANRALTRVSDSKADKKAAQELLDWVAAPAGFGDEPFGTAPFGAVAG
ncbi:MAG TPA: hypothetical protein VFV01_16960 [Spirillospora sp.]|nr:hypothetical protein [Spirillospora sp.]